MTEWEILCSKCKTHLGNVLGEPPDSDKVSIDWYCSDCKEYSIWPDDRSTTEP
jgi:peptide methionine sulfoxide reductase MsrB